MAKTTERPAWAGWRKFDAGDGHSHSVVDWDVFRAPNTPEGRLQLRLKDGQVHVHLGATVIASRGIPETWEEVVDWARMVAAVCATKGVDDCPF